jgi:hypothetical protein
MEMGLLRELAVAGAERIRDDLTVLHVIEGRFRPSVLKDPEVDGHQFQVLAERLVAGIDGRE